MHCWGQFSLLLQYEILEKLVTWKDHNIDEQKIIISTILFHFHHVLYLKTDLKHFSCFCRFSGHAVVVVERLLGHDLLPLVPVRQLHQLRWRSLSNGHQEGAQGRKRSTDVVPASGQRCNVFISSWFRRSNLEDRKNRRAKNAINYKTKKIG